MSFWKLGDGPGAHALVVGVGKYPWLVGGTKPLFPKHEGMGQLTSAPLSALAFATWLASSAGYSSRDYPLRSIEVLVSAAKSPKWAPRPRRAAKALTGATFSEFKKAVLAWHARLATRKDRGIFFFSGHGMSLGLQHTLVLEDYGSIPAAPLGFAFNFSDFQIAMAGVPGDQCYFLDACRMSSGTLARACGQYGDPILTADGRPPRSQPILYATLPGDSAYGRPNDTSLFTEALLLAMRGAGADRKGKGWAVKIGRLFEGLDYHLKRLAEPYGATQVCTVDQLVDLELHELAGVPEVPVVVDCRAPIDVKASTLTVSGSNTKHDQPPPVPVPWRLNLPVGKYTFSASPGAAPQDWDVYPAVTRVELP